MGDLSSRRGRVLGTEPVGEGRTLVRADVPQTEIVRYAIDLRAMSHGTGTFTRTFARYEPMPQHLADQGDGQGGLAGPVLAEQVASVGQQLRHDLGLANHGDEVCVAAPPRNDVLVHVFGQRSRRPRRRG